MLSHFLFPEITSRNYGLGGSFLIQLQVKVGPQYDEPKTQMLGKMRQFGQ